MTRKLRYQSLEAEQRQDGSWESNFPLFTRYLSIITDHERERIGPADGDPLAVVFYRIVERLGATVVEDDTKPSPDPPIGIVH